MKRLKTQSKDEYDEYLETIAEAILDKWLVKSKQQDVTAKKSAQQTKKSALDTAKATYATKKSAYDAKVATHATKRSAYDTHVAAEPHRYRYRVGDSRTGAWVTTGTNPISTSRPNNLSAQTEG